MKNLLSSLFSFKKVTQKVIFVMSASILFTSFFTQATELNTAQAAWENLVGERFVSRPEFAYVKNNPSLPNVLLYGDSISIHYTEQVRENLDNKANVYRLYRNGSDSGGVITKMNKMLSVMQNPELKDHWSFSWDVIHFNVGLHDLKYVANGKLDKVNGKLVSTITEYKNNLRNIVIYLKKLAPKAQLIFATTTPVPEGELGRFAGDEEKYNTAALDVLKDFPEVEINDLYQLTKPNHNKWWLKPGDVHYNPQGTKAHANKVAKVILSQNIFN
ncbi:SGNH/GDSL hydrolase family protein [Pseudocolwellia sp. AS88]|uniref:SGNH/GDSL hydrolase family protein n=1 Tax=Pseudocolwellia sp. AS88 TaxID=3063958 RepID=UPI0026F2F55F|nr:SGNH/GDSL hydrolase family protein [Pseudocolwellia sp. AS88]MDO7085546.1 SGNH/GDSL hydrolase family protein [Pseudocolwellia sp. AS88]